jgi:tetratricopeptide (TPR) repeat protein
MCRENWTKALAHYSAARVWSKLDRKALAFEKQGDLPAAESSYREALRLAEERGYKELVAFASNNLGELLLQRNLYQEGVALLDRALKLKEERFGPDDSRTCQARLRLGAIYWTAGDDPAAEEQFRQDLVSAERRTGPDSTETSLAIENVAAVCCRLGKYSEAEGLYQRAVRIAEKNTRRGDLRLGRLLHEVAIRLYVPQRNYEMAETLFLRALVVQEKATDQVPTCSTLDDLAEAYEAQGKLADAISTRSRWVDLMKHELGPEHAAVAVALEKSARTVKKGGDELLADAMEAEAARIRTAHPAEMAAFVEALMAKFGPEHPNVVTAQEGAARLAESDRQVASR